MYSLVVADIPSLGIPVDLEQWKRGGKWRHILADFGESAASWYLETNESVCLVKLRWVDFPLKIMAGIDLMGYEPEEEELAVAESKVTSTTAVSSTASHLADQLRRERIDAELESPLNEYGSKVWLVGELLSKKVISDDEVDGILAKTEYKRYGFVFHPPSDSQPDYAEMGAGLEAEGLPVTLVDYTLTDLDHEIRSFVEVLMINKEEVRNA